MVKRQALSTTSQLRLLYDASHYTDFLVNSSGQISVSPAGTFFTISGGLSACHFHGGGSTLTTGTLGTNVSSATVTGTDTDLN